MYGMELLSFVLGLVIGSFLNVCIYRIPQGISIITPPSHCTQCDKRLGIIDLVPVLSYLFLHGKCRYCKTKISARYPLVELFCGGGFLILYLKFGLTIQYLAMIFLFSGLVMGSMIDYDHQIIPDAVNLALLIGGIPLLVLQSAEILLNGLLGALVGFGLLFLIAVIFKGGMGGGDVKLAGILGLYLGWPNILVALLLSFVIGSIVGLAGVLIKKKTLKTALPFGPFLSIATLVVILWGQDIINWYVNIIIK